MPKVLISDALSPAAVQIFKDRGVEVDFQPSLGKDKEKLAAIVSGFDGLAIRSATKVSAKILGHEKGVFEAVTKARAESLAATTPAAAAAAENQMQAALKSIFAVAEAYPQLQASQNKITFTQHAGGFPEDTVDPFNPARGFYGVLEPDTVNKTLSSVALSLEDRLDC